MKTLFDIFIVLLIFLFVPSQSQAQIWKKLARHAEEKVKSEAEHRAERRIDNGIDKVYDKAEREIDGDKKVENSIAEADDNVSGSVAGKSSVDSNDGEKREPDDKPAIVWNKFDFVPGETVIFEDIPAQDEENGEFPSRWDLYKGNAEIAEVDGEKVIIFPHGGTIVPYMKNAGDDYLPEVFTVEFDAFFIPGYARKVSIYLRDIKNQDRNGNGTITCYVNGIHALESEGVYPGKDKSNWDETGGWRHFSIAFTNGKLKCYLDDTRLINIPHYPANPTGITLSCDGYQADKEFQFVKNFRIAEGGVKYYDRVLTDGKIVENGIRFDVNKATLKPESMGPINRIYKLMIKYPGLKFSIEGHTDSDGSDDFNMELSKKRAQTVMNKLIEMGIDRSRLKYTGWGESKPVAENTTPEGKANNRRVEFVKF